MLRRVLGADGRSRAFVNDQPVSGGAAAPARRAAGRGPRPARAAGAARARRSSAVCSMPMAGSMARPRPCAPPTRAGAQAEQERLAVAAEVERAAREEDYWRHMLAELDELAPAPGEEATLAETRARLMNREKLGQAIDEALAVAARRRRHRDAPCRRPADGRAGRAERRRRCSSRPRRRSSAPGSSSRRRARCSSSAGRALELDGDRLESGRGAAVRAACGGAQAPGAGRRAGGAARPDRRLGSRASRRAASA